MLHGYLGYSYCTKINLMTMYQYQVLQLLGSYVTRYLVRVHKWSSRTNHDDINGPTQTIYVVISGPLKT